MERQIAEYLLLNGKELIKEIHTYLPAYALEYDELCASYIERELCRNLTEILNVHYEEIATNITPEFLEKLLGKRWWEID